MYQVYSVPQPLVAQGRAGCQPVHMFIPNGTELSAWSREVRLLLILWLRCHLFWLSIRLLSENKAVAVAATSASTTSIATAAATSGTAAASTSGTVTALLLLPLSLLGWSGT